VSCAKTAEPIEMQFGTLSRVGPEHVLYGDVDAPTGRGTFGVSGRFKSIVMHRIWGLGKRGSCTKTDGPI